MYGAFNIVVVNFANSLLLSKPFLFGLIQGVYILAYYRQEIYVFYKLGLRKFTDGINGLEFTLDAQIKYLT